MTDNNPTFRDAIFHPVINTRNITMGQGIQFKRSCSFPRTIFIASLIASKKPPKETTIQAMESSIDRSMSVLISNGKFKAGSKPEPCIMNEIRTADVTTVIEKYRFFTFPNRMWNPLLGVCDFPSRDCDIYSIAPITTIICFTVL